MPDNQSEPSVLSHRVLPPPRGFFGSLVWIGPMLLLLGAGIGSGELLAEPAAGARYGGTQFWAILFIVVTKAMWNEAIGRVAIATGQDFLESCLRIPGPLLFAARLSSGLCVGRTHGGRGRVVLGLRCLFRDPGIRWRVDAIA